MDTDAETSALADTVTDTVLNAEGDSHDGVTVFEKDDDMDMLPELDGDSEGVADDDGGGSTIGVAQSVVESVKRVQLTAMRVPPPSKAPKDTATKPVLYPAKETSSTVVSTHVTSNTRKHNAENGMRTAIGALQWHRCIAVLLRCGRCDMGSLQRFARVCASVQ